MYRITLHMSTARVHIMPDGGLSWHDDEELDCWYRESECLPYFVKQFVEDFCHGTMPHIFDNNISTQDFLMSRDENEHYVMATPDEVKAYKDGRLTLWDVKYSLWIDQIVDVLAEDIYNALNTKETA